jgi:hypothetical protein
MRISLSPARSVTAITPVQVLTLIIMTLSGALTMAFNDERSSRCARRWYA